MSLLWVLLSVPCSLVSQKSGMGKKENQKAQHTQCTPKEPCSSRLLLPLLSHRLHHICQFQVSVFSLVCVRTLHPALPRPGPIKFVHPNPTLCFALTASVTSGQTFSHHTGCLQTPLSRQAKVVLWAKALTKWERKRSGEQQHRILRCTDTPTVTWHRHESHFFGYLCGMRKVLPPNDPQACHVASIYLWTKPDSCFQCCQSEWGSCKEKSIHPMPFFLELRRHWSRMRADHSKIFFLSSCFEEKVCIRIATMK